MQPSSQESSTSRAGLHARTAVRALTILGIAAVLTPANGTAAAQRAPTCQGRVATIVAAARETVVNGTPGDDVIVGNRLANVIHGGEGNDVICGGGGDDEIFGEGGADRIFGEAGDDTIDGGPGDDLLDGARGDDDFVWKPGDGSDVIEADGGRDVLLFAGSAANEVLQLSQSGKRVILTRSVAAVTLEIADLEAFVLSAAGGTDIITVGALDPRIVKSVSLDLDSTAGAGAGDGQRDQVVLTGTDAADEIRLAGAPGLMTVQGLGVELEIVAAEGADEVTVNSLGGDDTIDAALLEDGSPRITMNGGTGNDVLVGGPGADFVNGGDGDDLALLGPGDDTFVWNPGDDNDTVEGDLGFDVLQFNGSNVAETVELTSDGGRLRFLRNVGNVTMDTDDLESVRFAALGGTDFVLVNDLSGTDVVEVNVDLGSPAGAAGDGQPDTVLVPGTNGDDVILAVGEGATASVLGLAAQVNLAGVDAGDRLSVDLLDGDDVLDGSGLAANAVDLVGDGGAGNDVLIGGSGNDVLLGGAGDDVLLGGPGVDVLDGGPGDNIVIQG